MLLVRFIYTDTHLNTGILQLHPQITQYIDTIIRQLILLAGVMHTDFKIIIILQGRLAIDHRVFQIYLLVDIGSIRLSLIHISEPTRRS